MAVELVVPSDCPSMRLDQFVGANIPGASRRRLRHVELRLNGRLARHGTRVHAGDVVSVPEALLQPDDLRPNPSLSLPVLYQDEALVAVDKPAAMASVALRPDENETVANFLLAAFPEMRTSGRPLEGGLVHRLDQDTSGVLLAARSRDAYDNLRRQFSAHQVEKDYLALVVGDVAKAGRVDIAIAHDPRRDERMLACADAAAAKRAGARPASTHYLPVLRYGAATLVRLTMQTGVRHQVRLHLAFLGHPIVGDRLYGAAAAHGRINRQLLHACRIRLKHPTSGEKIAIESPLPDDFEAALQELRDSSESSW